MGCTYGEDNNRPHDHLINAKEVYHGHIELGKALNDIVTISGMERGSALDYVHDFGQMMDGNEYHRIMKTVATQYYLENIMKYFGPERFNNALQAVKAHTIYCTKQGHGSLRGIEKLVERFSSYNKRAKYIKDIKIYSRLLQTAGF